jgi:hypothetical protein
MVLIFKCWFKCFWSVSIPAIVIIFKHFYVKRVPCSTYARTFFHFVLVIILKHFIYVKRVPCYTYARTFFHFALPTLFAKLSPQFHFQQLQQHPKCQRWWIWMVHCRIQWLPPSTR